MRKPFISKQNFKHRYSKCRICGENNYTLLDVHRVFWGGKYENKNCVCLCVKCHRKVHNNKITIYGWVNSTKGRLLHIDDGEEKFI